MVDGPAYRHFNQIAAKWRDLAEKRRQYLVELYSSGRWKHYYKNEAQLILRVKAAMMQAEAWAVLIPREEPETEAKTPVPAARHSAA
jgi:uncharacterized repeat protein (TIGR03809 family)